MSEISAEERRRRRQERIKNGAADRLAKITAGNRGRVGEKSVFETQGSSTSSNLSSAEPSVLPLSGMGSEPTTGLSTPSAVSASTATPDAGPSPQANLSAKPKSAPEHFNAPNSKSPSGPDASIALSNPLFPNTNQSEQSTSFDDDPLFKLLNQLNSVGSDENQSAEDINAFASQFASMMGMPANGPNAPGSSNIPPPTAVPKSQKADLMWMILHFVVFVFLAITAGFGFSQLSAFGNVDVGINNQSGDKNVEPNALMLNTYSSSKLMWYFSTAELILQSTRFFIEKGAPPADSIIVTIANYIPYPFNEYFYNGARYIKMLRVIMQDFCVVLFVAGICSYFNK